MLSLREQASEESPHVPDSMIQRMVQPAQVEPLARVCPEGQVPQPTESHAPKGHPRWEPLRAEGLEASTSAQYFYASGYQYQQAAGMFGEATQHRPYLAPGDYHTLFELAAQSANGSQIVEVGWNINRAVNGSDTAPHLFVFHWIDGVPQCYNGCGWVQYSATRYPGMRLAVTDTPQAYGIEYHQGNWWVTYQGEWIGYFPGSRWRGTFTQIGLAQWFGEVAASSASPTTDMGNGQWGSSISAARLDSPRLRLADGGFRSASLQPYTSHASLYSLGNLTLLRFNYGGPGL
jgi:hypothetical protein